MGCCQSIPANASPYFQPEANSSSRAIVSTQPASTAALARPSTTASNDSAPHPNRAQAVAKFPNRPLEFHKWTSEDKLWTRKEVDKERIEFFDTQVTGRPEIWQTIRASLNILWNGGESEESLGTAQIILDAAGITIPSGDLAGGVYDEFGNFYKLSEVIVSDPTNLTPNIETTDDRNKEGEEREVLSEDEDEVLRRQLQKGKTVVNEADLVQVRVRLSNTEAQPLVLTISQHDIVRLVKLKVFDAAGLAKPQSIRLAYMGKLLEESKSLTAQGWNPDYVISALVFG